MCRARGTSRRHRSFPVLRSRAIVTSLSSSLAVRKIRSAVTTGDERANGTATFHARFFFAPNSVGKVEPSATPLPFGPRNLSHTLVAADDSEVFLVCCANAVDVKTNDAATIGSIFVYFIVLDLVG